jgi:hypothetical protein
MKCHFAIFLLVFARCCIGQALLEGKRLLGVTFAFRGISPPITKYSEVRVRAFDKSGNEVPVVPAKMGGDAFALIIGKPTPCRGFYIVPSEPKILSKIVATWKDAKIESIPSVAERDGWDEAVAVTSTLPVMPSRN